MNRFFPIPITRLLATSVRRLLRRSRPWRLRPGYSPQRCRNPYHSEFRAAHGTKFRVEPLAVAVAVAEEVVETSQQTDSVVVVEIAGMLKIMRHKGWVVIEFLEFLEFLVEQTSERTLPLG